MKKQFRGGSTPIEEFMNTVFQPEDPVLAQIRALAKANGLPMIQVGAFDGLHLEVITRSNAAEKAVEIGTLGGYSAVCIARGLKKDGKLYTLEVNSKHAQVAEKAFEIAGIQNQVELILGRAQDSLTQLKSKGPFDLVFIDADKEAYPEYLNWAAENLRVGGVLLADNTFGFGHIADPTFDDPGLEVQILALRKFNHNLAQNGRFRSTILPTGEGLSFGIKLK